uniref:Ig-like domain-containing protein n=1 Tax=Cyprinus carpio TaxID=7962 RepID=A0A8C2F3T2_CYPCA
LFTPSETKTNISIFFAGASNGDTITPDKTEEFAAEGSNVTLSCSYSSARSLHWYRQYPRTAPEFLVLISDSAKQAETSGLDHRLTTKIRKKEKQNYVDLEIFSAAVSDSALYYCALQPTVSDYVIKVVIYHRESM